MKNLLTVFALCHFLLMGCSKAPAPLPGASSVSEDQPQEIIENEERGNMEKSYTITGVDVSKYQGKVDFKKVKASDIHYVFVRATEGITYQDAEFASNLKAAREAGLVVGAYHFYETNDAPADQLQNFTQLVKLQKGDLPPVVDIEKLHNNDKSHLIEHIQTFLSGLESHYGVKPILYSGEKFANQYMSNFGNYPLWLAEYEVASPKVPQGWTDWSFWQWSQSGHIEGVEGAVDLDRFNGGRAGFNRLLIQ